MSKETYPKPGQQKRVRPVQQVSEFGNVDEWSENVLRNAKKWRLLNFVGDGKQYSVESDNFEYIVIVGVILTQANMRVLVEAVDEHGRFVPVPKERWGEFSKRFRERQSSAVQKSASGLPKREVLHGTDAGGTEGGKTRIERVRPVVKDRAVVNGVGKRSDPDSNINLRVVKPREASPATRRSKHAKPRKTAAKRASVAKKRKSPARKKR